MRVGNTSGISLYGVKQKKRDTSAMTFCIPDHSDVHTLSIIHSLYK